MAAEQSDRSGEEFVEALVQLHADAPAGELAEWCAEHGIDMTPMAAGALLTGPAGRFAEAFGERPGDRAQPQSLPVPPALRGTTRSVTVLPLPALGADTASPD
ncbi:hypothetical protein [Streptomyces tailanensis]|uniref:hypothetical protein n=1 Tax=Streptomyces tailanensis TaxID=2569858 RepID=UPI00122E696A|nr:hypothetical protein [Streptomyces tailanensis]